MIRDVRRATDVEWDHIWAGCDYATYFHSREWAEIWQRYTRDRLRPEPRLVTFADGTRALLPLSVQWRKGMVKNYFTSPEGTFGGWISEQPLSPEHARALAGYMTRKLGNLVWRLNPYDPSLSGIVFKDVYAIEDDETQALDLRAGLDGIHATWAKGGPHALKRKIVRAQKGGVTHRVGVTWDDWEGYYRVYQDSLRRWGPSALVSYDRDLFYEMFHRNSPDIRLWLSVYGSTIVAGAICFYARRHVVYWHGAALSEYFRLKPVILLLSEATKDACDRGYTWFDFNPSGGIEGVKVFKASLGTQSLPCPEVSQKTNLIRLYILMKQLLGRIHS